MIANIAVEVALLLEVEKIRKTALSGEKRLKTPDLKQGPEFRRVQSWQEKETYKL
jgi:hypothetical protein